MKIRLTKTFEKEFKKITRGNAALKQKISKQLSLVLENPQHPSLRLHKLKGQEYWSLSVDMSLRVLLLREAHFITVFHIGKHEDVY